MAGLQPGHKRCRESGCYNNDKGIISMKNIIANQNRALRPVECWNWRNVTIHAASILIAVMLAAFVAGVFELLRVQTALLCLGVGAIIFRVLLDLFPLKTWEVTNVRRPRT